MVGSAKACESAREYQGVVVFSRECQSMPRNVGDANMCRIVLRHSKTCHVIWDVKM